MKPPPLELPDATDATGIPTSVSSESLASPLADRGILPGVSNIDTVAAETTVQSPDSASDTSTATVFAKAHSTESLSTDNEDSEPATPISPTSPTILKSSTSSLTSSLPASPPQSEPTSPIDGRGKGVRFADDVPTVALDSNTNNTTNTTNPTNPTAPTASPNYPTKKEIFYFLKSLLDTLTAVLNSHPKNQSYFRGDIRFSTLTETLKACHFIEGEHAVELCDSLLSIFVFPPLV